MTMTTAVSLWPLLGVGILLEHQTSNIEHRTSNRHVPEQMWYTHPAFAIALGGVLPFGAVCIELFFIMSALWLHQVLAVVKGVLAVVSCHFPPK